MSSYPRAILVAVPTINAHFSSPTGTNNTFSSYPISIESCSLPLPTELQEKLKLVLLSSFTYQTMDASTSQTQPLQDRPTNTHLSNVDKTDAKTTDLSSMDYHRQMLQGKLDNGEK